MTQYEKEADQDWIHPMNQVLMAPDTENEQRTQYNVF